MHYEPDKTSLAAHPLPDWFDDAKLGIFVHCYPASVPGWAPTSGELTQVVKQRGFRYWLKNNPYTEWYANTLRIPGSPTQEYHRRTYGADFPYDAFMPMFRKAADQWNLEAWAHTFADAGARYVVMGTKHHDGFLLWPSWHPNPHKQDYQLQRDVIRELTDAVRAKGLQMGLYYSGGLDWTFNDHLIADAVDLIAAVPQQPEYAAYADAHWRELIERYEPSVLWNDIGFPAAANLLKLFADYYNTVPDGVINDRFMQTNLGRPGSLRYRLVLGAIRLLLPLLMKRQGSLGSPSGGLPADFRTPEYSAASTIEARKWEACRGMGYSFGYNRLETDEHLIAPDELIRSFIDMVSKNGNLLLNVGPMADGTIPENQLRRLRALGTWLRVNGEAIYATRPWVRAEGRTADGTPVRFTSRGDALYAILLGAPASTRIQLQDVQLPATAAACLLGQPAPITWTQQDGDLVLDLPAAWPASPAHALKFAPV